MGGISSIRECKSHPGSSIHPTYVFDRNPSELIRFGFWLLRRGNRESTVQRKLRFLKKLHGSIDDMFRQVLASEWCDKSKQYALITVQLQAGKPQKEVETVKCWRCERKCLKAINSVRFVELT